MSLHYLLDGYNIIHQMPQSHDGLEYLWQGLIRFIEIRRPQGSLNNKVTVVLDGHPGTKNVPASSIAKICFSLDETADERIKKMVQSSTLKKSIVVVTDDRAIQYAVRSLGAKVLGVKTFIKKGQPGKNKTGSKGMAPKDCVRVKKISKRTEHEITSEMKEIWVNRKKR